jgi:hypothetical protein
VAATAGGMATSGYTPLPPDGPVTFLASWLAYAVTETRAQVEGSGIRAAASRAIEPWPDDPDYESGGGWTSSTITASEPGANSPPSDPFIQCHPGPAAAPLGG